MRRRRDLFANATLTGEKGLEDPNPLIRPQANEKEAFKFQRPGIEAIYPRFKTRRRRIHKSECPK